MANQREIKRNDGFKRKRLRIIMPTSISENRLISDEVKEKYYIEMKKAGEIC